MTAYLDWLARERGLHFAAYEDLWRWSVEDLEGFWFQMARTLAVASSATTYDGSPVTPEPDAMFAVCARPPGAAADARTRFLGVIRELQAAVSASPTPESRWWPP